MTEKKPTRKKTTRKKTAKKKVTGKKVASKKKAGSRKTAKKVVRKKTSARKSSAKKTTSGGFARNLRRVLLLVLVAAILSTGLYTLYLSRQVTVKFEGKRWAVPARVYGQPLELYAGARITPQQLKAELERLGYRRQQAPVAPGTWGSSGQRYLLNTRAFRFWDEAVTEQSLQVTFDGEQISRLVDRNTGQEAAIVRLEAPMIESIYPSHNEDRILVQHSEIPKPLVDALLAVEDRDFYSHHGVNPRSILRALVANLRAGQVVQGGSTLTQQLVKNFFLTSERSLVRKLNEALMALIIDARYDKDEILEAYANEIYLGQDGKRAIHGFGLASRFYFNRPLSELDLSRIALLTGLIKGPSWYDPWRHPERARERRDLVLDLMAGQGMITSTQAGEAKTLGLGLKRGGQGGRHRGYPAFIKLVRNQLKRDYREEDLTSEGLRIFTTLNPWIQDQAQSQAAKALAALEKQHKLPAGQLQVAAVIASPASGEVLAVVGGRQASYSGFNRALDAVRPIGSLVKPLVYLAALMQPERWSLVTRVNDAPVSLTLPNGDTWEPRNYDKQSHGPVSLLVALANSYNQATVNLGMGVGLPAVINVLRKAGVQRPINAYPSLLLGALSLSPLEVTQVYQVLAAGGFYSSLRSIHEVLDQDHQPLQRYPLSVEQRLPPTPVYLVNTALQAVVASGTGRGLQAQLPASRRLAGKTGTTNDLRDSWFAGFSNRLVATVWVGRDDNDVAGLTGSAGAMQVWGRIINQVDPLPLMLRPTSKTNYVWIDMDNGQLGAEDCENAMQVPFFEGHEPRIESDCIKRNQSFFDRLFD